MRNAKYLNAREYAEMLRRGSNYAVADFAEEFLDALDALDEEDDIDDDVKTLIEIERLIEEKCPEYNIVNTEDAIADMITRLRPKQEYDL